MVQKSNHEIILDIKMRFNFTPDLTFAYGPRRPSTSWRIYTCSHQSPRRSKLTRTRKHDVGHLVNMTACQARNLNTIIGKQNRLWKASICRHQLCHKIYVVNLYWIEPLLYMLNASSHMLIRAHRSITETRILYITTLNLWTEHVACKRTGL